MLHLLRMCDLCNLLQTALLLLLVASQEHLSAPMLPVVLPLTPLPTFLVIAVVVATLVVVAVVLAVTVATTLMMVSSLIFDEAKVLGVAYDC